MEKRLVKVNPHILDLEEPEQDLQEALFSIREETLLKLDRNEATILPSPLVINALMKSSDNVSLNRQPDRKARKLRRKLSHYTGVNFDSIACFANMTNAVDTLARTYLQPGLDAVVSWPSENIAIHSLRSTGARIVFPEYPDPFNPNIEELIASITPKTRLVYIGNPNSISGFLFSEAEIVFLLSYAENVLVVIDESYFEFCGVSVTNLLKEYTNLVVIRSFSKAFALAGLDVSYLMTDARNLRFINRLGYHKEPNTLAQISAEAAIDDISYTANFISQINESKKMLYSNLTRMGYDFRITLANFFLVQARDPESLIEALTQNNIFVNSLREIEGFEDYIRITIGTPSQMGVLIDLLARFIDEQTFSSSCQPSERTYKNRLTRQTHTIGK